MNLLRFGNRGRRLVLGLLLILSVRMAGGAGQSPSSADPSDSSRPTHRQFLLESTMLGYRGLDGEIAGIRNPILKVERGETVRITIVNGETMIHDVALERHGVQSEPIVDEGSRTFIEFVALSSDLYYCTIPGHRQAGMEGRLIVSQDEPEPALGVLPEKEGRPLNFDFETGTLQDWTREGEAFEGQPTAAADGPALHGEGRFLIATGFPDGSLPTGTLTSVPFEVTHPYATFRLSGGAYRNTRVELVRSRDQEVFFSISGTNESKLRPVVVDLQEYLGQEVQIRILDLETGEPSNPHHRISEWAHINFDDFRFHQTRPYFSDELRLDDLDLLPPLEPVKYSGLSPQEAVAAMTLPPGFSVSLAAAEPETVRPIALALDDRARLWVAEAYAYPVRAPEGEERDRILIFEDSNGDGRLDRRVVFYEGLNLVSGLEVGFGGVWVGAAPYFLFIPIDESGERPAGPPQILLDGWGYQDTHETLNAFIWGPDGWLYGCHGIYTHSNVGKPGSAESERLRLNAAIWRYHPTRHVFEIYSEGTSNPWGLDFNDYGHAFATVCVIPHLHFIIQGGRYQRQTGQHFNPHTYDDIKSIGDHVHWVGNRGWAAGSRRGGGGGHAHAGAMIYLGGDGWGREYRSRIFMNNIHGYRTNTDILERHASGYVGRHGPDFLLANDTWSQMINFRYGPDGSVYVIDWYDKNQCHSPNPAVHDKSLGRIYKIRHETDHWTQVDLTRLPSRELVDLQLHPNDWYVRHARRLLQERGPNLEVHEALKHILHTHRDVTRRLRALWALHVTGGLDEDGLLALLSDPNEEVRGWAVQLICEDRNPSPQVLERFAEMARRDTSPLVRLYLAAALQRVALDRRWEILEGLFSRVEDGEDPNLPLMIWYAAEPMSMLDPRRALNSALKAQLPRIAEFTIRRMASRGDQEALALLSESLGQETDQQKRLLLLKGIEELVRGGQ